MDKEQQLFMESDTVGNDSTLIMLRWGSDRFNFLRNFGLIARAVGCRGRHFSCFKK
jgi:hypothetical protein